MSEKEAKMRGEARPKLLDLFCGAGGAGMGYHRAGFDVVGVDIKPQPRYPFAFVQGDATTHPLDGFDAIHASPPCQAHSSITRVHGESHRKTHLDWIAHTRDRLTDNAAPWVIENVPGAPLRRPVVLCGTMFKGLRVYRHRLFESPFIVWMPEHPKHTEALLRCGLGPNENGWMSCVGHFPNVEAGRAAMGCEWMTRDEISQAIPPAYTEFIGKQLLASLSLKPGEEIGSRTERYAP